MLLSAYVWASTLRESFVEKVKAEAGQGMVEYTVIVSFMGLLLAGVFFLAGDALFDAMDTFVSQVVSCIGLDGDECGSFIE